LQFPHFYRGAGGIIRLPLREETFEPLAKAFVPVILRERSDRRISEIDVDARFFAALRMTKWGPWRVLQEALLANAITVIKR
jgi:hypothetical protein